MGISVILSSHNSARHIARVLESVKNFDEIVVCDMESKDNTRDIISEYGVKIVRVPRHSDKGYLRIRDYALKEASSEWVLILRPDEVVTPHLVKYLYEFIADPGEYKGVFIPRKSYLFNRLRDTTYPDYQLRFFKRSETSWPSNEGSDPKINGKVKKIPAPKGELALIKLPRTLHSLVHVLHGHSHEHNEAAARHGNISAWKMIKVPVAKFLKEYLLKGKIRYGTQGYVTSVNKALQHYFAMAKRHEDTSMEEFYELIDDIIAGRKHPIIPQVKEGEHDEHADHDEHQ